MAFLSTQVKHDICGTMQVKIFSCNFASVTTGAVKTGFSNIHFADFVNNVSEAQGLVKQNIAADGSTAEVGTVNVSGVTASDTGKLIVYGN